MPSVASDCKKVQKLWRAVQETDSVLGQKNSYKITRSSFWSELFRHRSLYNCLSCVCSEFFDLSCRSTPNKSITTCCSVFTDSVLFCLSFILQIKSLLFLCKNLLAILRNSSSSRLSLFLAGKKYFIMGTNLANQIMMSYVWREFSSVRGKMIKRFRSVKRSSLGMPLCTPKKYSRRLKRLSLGMPPCIPFSINIISSSFVPLYFNHFMCYVLCLERLAFSFLLNFLELFITSQNSAFFMWERNTLHFYLEHNIEFSCLSLMCVFFVFQ